MAEYPGSVYLPPWSSPSTLTFDTPSNRSVDNLFRSRFVKPRPDLWRHFPDSVKADLLKEPCRIWEHVTHDVRLARPLDMRRGPTPDIYSHDDQTAAVVQAGLDEVIARAGKPTLVAYHPRFYCYQMYLRARADLQWPTKTHGRQTAVVEDAYLYAIGPVDPEEEITEADLPHLNVVRLLASRLNG